MLEILVLELADPIEVGVLFKYAHDVLDRERRAFLLYLRGKRFNHSSPYSAGDSVLTRDEHRAAVVMDKEQLSFADESEQYQAIGLVERSERALGIGKHVAGEQTVFLE